MKNRQLPFDKLSTHQNTKAIDFTNNGGVFVIPYSFLSGGENISESGIISGRQLDTASFLEYVFTGREALKVCWDGSTLLSPYSENSNLFQYDFFVGNYFIGKPVSGSCSGSTEISSVEGNDDFLAMKNASVITLHFEYDEPISFEEAPYLVYFHKLLATDEYKRRVYKIPELGGNKWYYISNATPVFDDTTGRVIGEEIEFSTILDQIQNSGKAIEQYIQNNAPGEPYASPQINISKDENGREIKELVLNESTSRWGNDKTIKYIQIEQQGTSGTGGAIVIGRRIQWDDTNKVWYSQPWSFLLPSNWYQFNNNPLNKTSLPTSTFNFIPNFKLKMSSTVDWIKLWKEVNDSLSTMSFAGRVVLGQKEDWNGQYFTGEHKSNLNDLAYWDPNWLPYFRDQPLSFDMKGLVYTAPTLSFKNTDSFTNTFIKNSFICLNNLLLPTDFEQKKPYRISNIPVIGGLISSFIGDRTINPNTYSKTQEGLGCFIDKTFLRTLMGITGAINDKEVGSGDQKHTERFTVESFLNAFGGEMIPKYFGSTCYNTTLCFKLSDKINQTQFGITQDVPTTWFGQTKKEDGTYIFSNKEPCNLQDDFTVLNSDYGFVIDKIITNNLFSGNIRITCYSEGFVPQYATTIVSTAKWLDNAYNNWTSEITLGGWPSDYVSYFYNPTWPETPTYADTNYPINFVIDKNINDKSAYDSNNITYDYIIRNNGTPVYETGVKKEASYTQISGKVAFQQDIAGRVFTYAYGLNYDDRDDFISKVKSLVIDTKNSSIGISKLDDNDTSKIYNAEYQNAKNITFDLQTGVYEYNKDIIFGFIDGDNIDNYEVVGEVVNTNFGNNWSKCLEIYYRQAEFNYTKRGGVGPAYLTSIYRTLPSYYVVNDLDTFKGYLVAHIKLTLGESLADGLQLQISNIKHIVGNRISTKSYSPSGSQGDEDIRRQSWAPHQIQGTEIRGDFDRLGQTSRLNLHLVFNGMNKVNRS